MGERSDTPLKLQPDRRLFLEFRGAAITSDAGLLACRELDAAPGLTETANDYIHESRTGRNVQHVVALAQTLGVHLCINEATVIVSPHLRQRRNMQHARLTASAGDTTMALVEGGGSR